MPLLLCYSRAYHSIVDQFGLGILPVVSTGNTLLHLALGRLLTFRKEVLTKLLIEIDNGYNRLEH